MTPLKIGNDSFSLPIELVTSTQAILARNRSGKSYTASVQAEELLRHKQQIAAIDLNDAWRGAAFLCVRRWVEFPGCCVREEITPRRRSKPTRAGRSLAGR